jgi:hypothetical protein
VALKGEIMVKRGRIRASWLGRILCVMLSALSLLATLGATAASAQKAPAGKPTTTTSPTTTSTTVATTAGGGGNGGGGVANPKLTAVVSLSRHRALATYDRDLDAATLQVSSYAIYSKEAVNLPVTAVSRATNNQVFLVTGPQEPVTYEMKQPKTSRPVTFTGSTVVEPKLLGARTLSRTQIVVIFSEPIGASALQPSAYNITVAGSTATLAVNGAAAYGSTGKEVLLITAPQQPVQYVLNVGDIQTTSGVYIDPTAISVEFTGSTVAPGPMLVSAVSDGDTRVVLSFDVALDPTSATTIANYIVGPNLSIASATMQGTTQVVLITSPQYQGEYSIVANVKGADGSPVNPSFNSATFTGAVPRDTTRPKVVSAASVDNKHVVVQFSKPMADDTADTSRYVIVQTVIHPEVGALTITGAEFVAGTDRKSVRLTTLSQAEVTYQVTVNNVTDVMGNPLADRTNVAGVIVDPTSATFPGNPPAPGDYVNTDKDDTLWDHEETRGWQITIKFGDGNSQVRQVTSSPYAADTDGDNLKDHEERALGTDPRDRDTDDDGIEDEVEFNVYFTDPTNQDGDGDGLYDGLEVSFFLTSPLFDDTDGDQLKDGYEINVNRNPKVADLPQPVMRVGEMRMGLDVRFMESNGTSSSLLATEHAEATLVQSASQEFGTSDSSSHEAGATIAESASQEFEFGYSGGFTAGASFGFSQDSSATNTNSWTSEFTENSTQATEQSHTNSLTTEVTAATDTNVTREVVGANLQVAVSLESRGNVAFTARNLQVAAFIQDPDDPKRLTPIGTLVPETGLDTSFNLGPLVPPKGPIVFSSTTVYPQLVDELMKDPRGLVFRFANYDIVDEGGRNFAFTSQEVNDRTARIAIDYGGFDPDGDGRGTDTEILRVATGIIGRVVDTNADGVIDANDRKVVFGPDGKQVGITLRDALSAAGLKWYDEAANPSSTLSAADKQNSYSTRRSADGSFEGIIRVRDRQLQLTAPESWEIIGKDGIDRTLDLDERILYPGTNVTLSFMADLDRDGLPALTEAVHGCKESANPADGTRDTDNDGLDDRYEVLIGWKVTTPLGTREVHSKCTTDDSDGDGLKDIQEAPGLIKKDANGLVIVSGVDAPRRNSSSANGSIAAALEDPVTDPRGKDTDADGLGDGFELTPYKNALTYGGTNATLQATSPEHPDTDGDGLSDGVERKLGGDPRTDDSDRFTDSDGDGLTDAQEVGDDNQNFVLDDAEMGWFDENGDGTITPDEKKLGAGWEVKATTMRPRSATGDPNAVCRDGVCPPAESWISYWAFSSKFDADTDDDGLTDYEERMLGTDPGCFVVAPLTCDPNVTSKDLDQDGVRDGRDTDRDGLSDFDEVRGFKLRDGSTVKTKPTNADTDNDKRSDGEEAGLAGGEFIVRLPGGVVYEAFTHPLRADTDFDLLVDGDEQSFGIDPTKPNTDGDNASDYSEVIARRRPAVPDLMVKVHFTRLLVTQDSEPSGDAGDFEFRFELVRPDGTSKLVVHSEDESLPGAPGSPAIPPLPLGELQLPWSKPDGVCTDNGSANNHEDRCFVSHVVNGTEHTIIRIMQGESLPFGFAGAATGGRTEDIGSVSTTEAVPEQFGLKGWVNEKGEATHHVIDCRMEIFPDIFGDAGDGTGLVQGKDLRLGQHSIAIHRQTVDQRCSEGGLEFTLVVSYTAL